MSNIAKLKSLVPFNIASIFTRMEIAEQVIASNLAKVDSSLSPDEQLEQLDTINDSFKYLVTNYELPSKLFRCHCQQIIDHLLAGTPLPATTDAEILLILSRTSNQFPINREYRCAFSKLFIEWFPNEHRLIDETSEPETYDNYERARADEIIAEMREGFANVASRSKAKHKPRQRKRKKKSTPPAIDLSSMDNLADFLKV